MNTETFPSEVKAQRNTKCPFEEPATLRDNFAVGYLPHPLSAYLLLWSDVPLVRGARVVCSAQAE